MRRVDNVFMMFLLSVSGKKRNFAAFVLLLFAISAGILNVTNTTKKGKFTTARSTTMKTPVFTKPTTAKREPERKPYELQEQIAKFIPFPHASHVLGVAATGDNACQWISVPRDSFLAAQLTSRSSSSLLSYENRSNQSLPPKPRLKLDAIQRAAFKDTICLPDAVTRQQHLINTTETQHLYNTSETKQQALISRDDDVPHVFSTSEAITCLRNKTIIVAGDSYMKQLYIGLIEILAGRPVYGQEIHGAHKRDLKLAFAARKANALLLTHDVDVSYKCDDKCYPQQSRPIKKNLGTLKGCLTCLHNVHGHPRETVTVVGSAVHLVPVLGANGATAEILKFIDGYKHKQIFVSPPSYQTSKVPLPYRNNSRATDKVHWELQETIPESYDEKARYMDIFQMTRSCTFENCSTDGGHRARFVNRWKAQMLLNMICDIS